jgi:hypothetical protein
MLVEAVSQQSTCQPAGSLAPSAQSAARSRFRPSKRVARILNWSHLPAAGATPVDAEPAQVSPPEVASRARTRRADAREQVLGVPVGVAREHAHSAEPASVSLPMRPRAS